jgi:hypothetical protein
LLHGILEVYDSMGGAARGLETVLSKVNAQLGNAPLRCVRLGGPRQSANVECFGFSSIAMSLLVNSWTVHAADELAARADVHDFRRGWMNGTTLEFEVGDAFKYREWAALHILTEHLRGAQLGADQLHVAVEREWRKGRGPDAPIGTG